MIVDTSAIVSVVLGEEGYEPALELIKRSPHAGIGTPTLVETGIVLCARLGPSGKTTLARFVDASGLVVVPFEDAHREAAVDAFLRFGKGRHPAGLNLGDCMTYATARLADAPLLCLGDDFPQTDLRLALA